jgi:hypothetical protein
MPKTNLISKSPFNSLVQSDIKFDQVIAATRSYSRRLLFPTKNKKCRNHKQFIPFFSIEILLFQSVLPSKK